MTPANIKNLEKITLELLKEWGENPTREGLIKTPH